MIGLGPRALVVAQQVLQLAHVVLQLIQVLRHGVQARGARGAVDRLRGRGTCARALGPIPLDRNAWKSMEIHENTMVSGSEQASNSFSKPF